MIVTKIIPQGYCKGVVNALKKTLKAINDKNTKRPLYLLGMIIHNTYVCNALEVKGVNIIKSNKTRLEMLDEIDSGTIIISAHGTSKNVFQKAKDKGLDIIDCTCENVSKIHDDILRYIDLGYEILYIGTKNHPECEGILGESNKIHLIDHSNMFEMLDNTKKYYITNQTTLSQEQVDRFHNNAKKYLKDIVIEDNICNATTLRQNALYKYKADLLIVVGDIKSSNSKKLVEKGFKTNNYKQCILIENVKELYDFNLDEFNSACVTSGASTPNIITEEVIDYLLTQEKKESVINSFLMNPDVII